MARKSIESRCQRIMDTLLPIGSMKRAEYELPDHLKAALDYHRSRTAAIFDRLEKTDAGTIYAGILDGTLQLPAMPKALRDALGLVDPPTITSAMSISEAGDIWHEHAKGPKQ